MRSATSRRHLSSLLAALLLSAGAVACGGSGGEPDQSVTIPSTPLTDPAATTGGSTDAGGAPSSSSASSAADGGAPAGTVSPLLAKDDAVHVVGSPGRLWVWATVDRAAVVRRTPAASARSVGTIATTTPEGTAGNVQILATQTVKGATWTRVAFPSLPNGGVGWVPRSTLGALHLVDTQLTIDRKRLVATLRRDGRVVFTAPVGVGQNATPTPSGTFFIRDVLAGFDGSPVYGPVAFGTSARSAVLTDWPAGGYVGIHGTNEPQLIPGQVSHGCVRLRNADILRLSKLMPVGSSVRIL
jgi:lipoprotein-anchoring transpeptidase ErfK/SrfK